MIKKKTRLNLSSFSSSQTSERRRGSQRSHRFLGEIQGRQTNDKIIRHSSKLTYKQSSLNLFCLSTLFVCLLPNRTTCGSFYNREWWVQWTSLRAACMHDIIMTSSFMLYTWSHYTIIKTTFKQFWIQNAICVSSYMFIITGPSLFLFSTCQCINASYITNQWLFHGLWYYDNFIITHKTEDKLIIYNTRLTWNHLAIMRFCWSVLWDFFAQFSSLQVFLKRKYSTVTDQMWVGVAL